MSVADNTQVLVPYEHFSRIYNINRYSLLSDNKYYRYLTFPYTPESNAMCILYKVKNMCNNFSRILVLTPPYFELYK